MSERIAVLGAGSWGTALAVLLADNNHDVAMWEHIDSVSRELKDKRENTAYLHGVKIPTEIFISSKLSDPTPFRSGRVAVYSKSESAFKCFGVVIFPDIGAACVF